MRKILFFTLCLCFSLPLFSQAPNVAWGEEFKMRKGATSLSVIHADKSGVYLKEEHLVMKSYFLIGATMRGSARLVKLDKNLSEVFSNDFNKELRGKEFDCFFAINDKLYIIASEYIKSDASFILNAAEIDKTTGEISGTWKQLLAIQQEEKSQRVAFKVTYNTDSSRMVVVSTAEGKAKNSYRVVEFTETLKPVNKGITISNEFDPKTYQLEDLVYTTSNRIILVGRIYEYREGKKKKDKFLDFANYNIRIYDETGKQQKELNTSVNGKWLTSTKLIQENNSDLILAAFYSNDRKDKTIDGLLVQRINPVTGDVILTSEKSIDKSMLSDAAEDAADNKDDEKLSKEERREKEKLDKIKNEGEAFSTLMKFRNIFYSSDGGVVVLAEKYNHYTYTSQSFHPGTNGAPGSWSFVNYSVYESGDLLMCRINPNTNVDWLHIIPKQQREVTIGGVSTTSAAGANWTYTGFFEPGGLPYYSGFGAMQSAGRIYLFFNDHSQNVAVMQPGQKTKTIQRFGKSECHSIILDAVTGKCTRNLLFANADIPTSMPRLGAVMGKDMYIVGKDERAFGKNKVAVGRISLN